VKRNGWSRHHFSGISGNSGWSRGCAKPEAFMRFEGGLWATAAVLGIAATVGISNTPAKPSEPPGARNSVESPARASPPAMKSLEGGPCRDLEQRLQDFLLVDENEIVAPGSCYVGDRPVPSQKLLEQAKHMRFVIATLPDPLHTHFPLIFDRSAEAIQEAAQDDQYVYNSSWLPWETEQASYTRIVDEDKAEKRTEEEEDQPGILLFRRKSHKTGPQDPPFESGLAVLIVGEEPTGGIHRRQFENAVQWIAALQPGAEQEHKLPVQILGPSFSGSIPSLAELLRNPTVARAATPLLVFSGSITSDVAVGWLKGVTVTDPVLSPLEIEFRSFAHSGDVDLDRYCRYLTAAGTDLARLAIVSEDETAFGGEYGTGNANKSPCRPVDLSSPDGAPKQGPVHLYYPRDISGLRAAYQSQSIFSRTSGQAGGDPSHHILQEDLADPEGKDHDTIRAYGGNQTALSQEAELQQIVSLMRVHKTEYILLRSSNPLDQLFLSQFFRMTYPAGRIVIVGADLLLRRETGASGLNGVMTLSTYPLLPWEQDWTKNLAPVGGRFHSHRAFTNNGVEGTYFAARLLLYQPPQGAAAITSGWAKFATAKADGEDSADNGFVPSNCIDSLDLPDYAAPFWMEERREERCHHPPTWLSVVGNGGFWPVAVMDFPTDLGSSQPRKITELGELETPSLQLRRSFTSIFKSIVFLFGGDSPHASAGTVPEAWLGMPLSMKFLMLAGLFWAAFHAHCCCRASITAKPAHRAHFVRPNCNSVEKPTTCDGAFLRHQQNSHRALVLLGSLLVALLPITLAWGYGEMWEGGEPLPNPWAYRLFLPIMWLAACGAVCANTWIEDYLFQKGGDAPVSGKKPPAAVWRSFLLFAGISFALYWCLEFFLDTALTEVNRIPTYWRAINLTTGVSPLVPLVALIAGLYCWFWFSLQGLALFGVDRPRLPKFGSLQILQPRQDGHSEDRLDDMLRMLSSDYAAKPIEQLSSPFAPRAWVVAGGCFVGILAMAHLIFGYPPIRNLGSNHYSVVFGLWLVLCISILLANAFQLSLVWLRLRLILQFLDRLPLRRTMGAFQGFSWGSVWKMGGSVFDMRDKLTSRQMESLMHLRGSLVAWQRHRDSEKPPFVCGAESKTETPGTARWIDMIDKTIGQRVAFAKWYSSHWDEPKARRVVGLTLLQEALANTAGAMLIELLIPSWQEESKSFLLGPAGEAKESGEDKTDLGAQSVAGLPQHIRNTEELVCLVYMAFIQNALGRMRSLVMGIICMFIAITVAISSYPFDPRPLLSGMVVTLFCVLGATIVVVYSQMHRDTTLSNLTDTKPGELGSDFWIKLIGFGAGPILGLIASIFPEFTDFLFSWVQPGLGSLK
jgi:hypothetical protein